MLLEQGEDMDSATIRRAQKMGVGERLADLLFEIIWSSPLCYVSITIWVVGDAFRDRSKET